MKRKPAVPNRLKAATPALGEANETEIERRAIELARSDGRDAFTDADLDRAAAELATVGTPPPPPEAAPALEEVATWDDPPDQAGHRVERLSLEDETAVAGQLVEDGLEEADHDIRAAADEGDAGDSQ